LANLYLRDRTDIMQKIAEQPTQGVFIQGLDGKQRNVARIEDGWHRLESGARD
jgi:hypothetical protein